MDELKNMTLPSAATESSSGAVSAQTLSAHPSPLLKNELAAGLLQANAAISPKYFYDPLGSALFAAICQLPEYYPTRTEHSIFIEHAPAVAQAIGPCSSLIDLGAADCAKGEFWLPWLKPQQYVAVDISSQFLSEALARLKGRHPALPMTALGVDFSVRLNLPAHLVGTAPLFFYPGSSISNFSPKDASAFLQRIAQHCCSGGGLLIGADLMKAEQVLLPAYDDALGVTAAFNRNILQHVNRLLGADFEPSAWRHVVLLKHDPDRIEMHLEATKTMAVRWAGEVRRVFQAGERIHTENSHKYSIDGFTDLLREAGFSRVQYWTDRKDWFALFLAQV